MKIDRAALRRWRETGALRHGGAARPQTQEQFVLYPAEERFVREFWLRADGALPFREYVFSAPKKSGKTGLAAMLVVHRDDQETRAVKRLMSAVLSDAVRRFQAYAHAQDPAGRLRFAEAQTWILDRKAEGHFAFVTICEALGIDPDRMRDSILHGSGFTDCSRS